MAVGDGSPGPSASPRLDPRWKILYLVAITAGALAIPSWLRPYVVPALLLLQIVLLWWLGVSARDLVRTTTRLKGLFLFLILCYLFLPAPKNAHIVALPLGVFDWSVGLNLTGLGIALVMCGQILTVILASAVVRLSGSESDLVDGLQKLRCPRLLVYSIDNTLALLGGLDRRGMGRGQGQGGGGGRGGGRGDGSGGGRGAQAASAGAAAKKLSEKPSEPLTQLALGPTVLVEPQLSQGSRIISKPGPGFWTIVRRLLRGDVGFLVEAIQTGMERAAERSQRTMGPVARLDRPLVHDVQIVSGIALLMMSMKILKMMPGIAFASGHKTLILIPLYILAAQLTYSRFGATTAGTIMGLIGYLNGDGRYGVLDILKHVVPGLVIDLLWPLFRRLPRRIWIYSILGIIAAVCRISTELALAFVLGARWEVFLGLAWRVTSNLLAGTLSGAVTFVLLPAFRGLEPERAGTPAESRAGDSDFSSTPRDAVPTPVLSAAPPSASAQADLAGRRPEAPPAGTREGGARPD